MQRMLRIQISLLLATAATAALMLNGCSGDNGKNGQDAVSVPAQTTGTVNSSNLTTDDLKNSALSGKILSASIPGNQPVVKFQVVNKTTGKGVAGLATFSLHVAQLKPEAGGSNSYWQNYISAGLPVTAIPANTERGASVQTAPINPSADAVTVFNSDGTIKAQGYSVVDHGDGTYTATFGANIKANTTVPYDGSLTHRIGISVRSVAVPGVIGKTSGAYAGPIDPTTNAVMAQFTNTNGAAFVYDFVPSTGVMLTDAGGKQAFARDLVTIAACNQCHYKLEYGSNNTSGHFGSRPDTKLCVMCHTPQLAAGEGDFTNFIHKIHMGENLPTVESPVGVAVNEFKYPQDIRNCTMCHKGADASNMMSKPSRKACGSCHSAIVWATGAGHTNGAASSDISCNLCHADVAKATVYHQTTVSTPNNPTTAAGLANFTYAISKVEVNATTRQAEITFQIKQDGAAVTFATFDPAVIGQVPLSGFTSGPSLYVEYSVPQDGITAPADFNVSTSVSLTNLWNGTQGTLVADAAGSYKATLTGTVASPVALPASAKMVTGSIIGGFTQTSAVTPTFNGARLALQVSKVATGFTARRTIVSNALCNNCHEQLGIKPSFHSGARNEAAACAYCHNPNRTSSGWSAGSSNFIHAIHAASKRSTDFNWQSSLKYWTVGYPGVLKNCEACHVSGSYDFGTSANAAAVPNLLPIAVATAGSYVTNTTTAVRPATSPATYYAIGDVNPPGNATSNPSGSLAYLFTVAVAPAVSSDSPYVTASAYGPGFAFVPATGVTYPASGENLVNSPISSACFSCHDTSAAKAHMVLNGGSIYEKRSITLTKTETCLICHGAASSTNISNATAPTIKAVHRWW